MCTWFVRHTGVLMRALVPAFPDGQDTWPPIYGVHKGWNYMTSLNVHRVQSAWFFCIKGWNVHPNAVWEQQRHQLCFLLTRTLTSPLKFCSLPSPDRMFNFSGLTNHVHITCRTGITIATQDLTHRGVNTSKFKLSKRSGHVPHVI